MKVEVHFFKESGKWYTTESVNWPNENDGTLPGAFHKALIDHLKGKRRLLDMIAVCINPNHKNAYPQMSRMEDVISLYEETGLYD